MKISNSKNAHCEYGGISTAILNYIGLVVYDTDVS